MKYRHDKELYEEGVKYSNSITIGTEEHETEYLKTFKQNRYQLLDLFIVNFVTYSIFPGIEANIRSSNDLVPKKYFEAVFTFLLTNLFIFVGNICAQFFECPRTEIMIGFVSVRFILIPMYLFLNYHPKHMTRTIDPLIKNDYILIVANIVTAITGGYLSVICFRHITGVVTIKHRSSAAMLAAFASVTGMFCRTPLIASIPRIDLIRIFYKFFKT